jgi:hypothetical protein
MGRVAVRVGMGRVGVGVTVERQRVAERHVEMPVTTSTRDHQVLVVGTPTSVLVEVVVDVRGVDVRGVGVGRVAVRAVRVGIGMPGIVVPGIIVSAIAVPAVAVPGIAVPGRSGGGRRGGGRRGRGAVLSWWEASEWSDPPQAARTPDENTTIGTAAPARSRARRENSRSRSWRLLSPSRTER